MCGSSPFHCWYLYGLLTGMEPRLLMYITLCAYGAYVINATQWILKLRAARLLEASERAAAAGAVSGDPAGVAA